MAEAAAADVAVLGVPSDVADELLVFYFENRRRSGGGPVQSWRRRGGRATLTFERPEDAQRVLSRSDHALQEVQLTVQPAAPRDYGKVVLRGLNPQSSLELVELFVEHLLDCERDAYSIWRSPARDQVLVQLQAVLSHSEMLIFRNGRQGARTINLRRMFGKPFSNESVNRLKTTEATASLTDHIVQLNNFLRRLWE
uniref:Poly(ADP-ribose) polymerase family member 10 n=1 Tax=Naja naja TaxID=35670 RepID=A0A8C6X1Y3_NAJNA